MAMTPLQQKFHRLIRATGTFDEAFYARGNPDAAARWPDLLEHYIVNGERENRKPNPFFDPAWYRRQAPKLRPEDNLLAHHLTVGDRDGIQPMPGFDPAYVRQRLGSRLEPALVGFLKARAAGRLVNPCRFFDYAFYLKANPDVARARLDGFLHFVYVGADEGREPAEGVSWFLLRERYQLSGGNAAAFRALMSRWRHLDPAATRDDTPSVLLQQEEVRNNHRPSELYEPAAAPPIAARRACDVYAFYLTQYHRVPENDAWWGEGFTEWHNVARGLPRFSGHYQPRVPSALGFYDLDDARVMPRQVALAKQAGLAGFAFYYYHFGARRLLERPLERFLADASLDLGFFLIWANESWSRRWDGSEDELLLEQTYPPELPETLAADLARHFADPRYRRIDGRPLFVIYRVGAIPDTRAWLARLRAAFAALGERPLIYLSQSFADRDPRAYGLDGAMEFPPHKHSRSLALIQPERLFGANPGLKVWSYDDFARVALADPAPDYPLIRGCFPSWDNDSRRQGPSSIIHGSTPAAFRAWLAALVARAEADPRSPPIVVVNAWNEWGEGAYLEPDRHFGHAYLNAVQAVLHPEVAPPEPRVLLIGHDAFAAGAQRILLNIGRTLKRDLGRDVAFLLLRADGAYGGLLDEHRAIGETIVAGADLPATLRRLAARGFGHAIVNSAAASGALATVEAAGIVAIHLIHELPEMFARLDAAGPIAAAGRIRRFVAATPAIAAMLAEAGAPPSRIAVRPQGLYRAALPVDRAAARAALLDGAERPLVAGLGYADPRKGIDLFLAAAAATPAARFVWQGDWDPETATALADDVARLEAAGRFARRPGAPDIDTLLAAADVFFLASREDPLPSAAIEAWSAGLPIVAFPDAGGISDLIARDGSLGVLAASAEPEAIVAALEAARALGRSEARAAWARETYDWARYVRGLLVELLDPPTVDVAIVGRDHGRFAEARIGSLVRQTLPARDIAYHDVASTDDSPATIRAAAGALGVRFVAAPDNVGRLFATWEAIAAASDADHLHIAEGDDWIAPTMIERCVAALARAPDAAFAFVGVEWIDESGAPLADHGGYPARVIGPAAAGGEIPAATMLGSEMTVRNPILTISSVVWRRSALLAVLRANRRALGRLTFAFDWLLYLRAARAGHSAAFVPETLCRHRQHGRSFAARDDLARHAEETRRLYRLVPAAPMAAKRAAYLAEIGGS